MVVYLDIFYHDVDADGEMVEVGALLGDLLLLEANVDLMVVSLLILVLLTWTERLTENGSKGARRWESQCR